MNRRTTLLLLSGLVFFTILSLTLFFATSNSKILPNISWLDNDPTFPTQQSRIRPGPTTYIPFTFGWTMLLQSLRGYQIADWPNIVIVDNSWNGYAYADREMLREIYGIVEVIPTPVHLRFAQIQGYMDNLARNRDIDQEAYFWAHTDVLLVPNPGEDVYTIATDCVRRENVNGTLGVLWFHYDRLSAVTIEAGKVAPWDVSMPQYGSDCDRYKRLRLAGLETKDCDSRWGDLIHIHSVLSEEEMEALYDESVPLEERVAVVQAIEDSEDQYSWRKGDGRAGITDMDTQAKFAEGEGGRGYMEAKWGWSPPCELEGRFPAFDVPTFVDWGEDVTYRDD